MSFYRRLSLQSEHQSPSRSDLNGMIVNFWLAPRAIAYRITALCIVPPIVNLVCISRSFTTSTRLNAWANRQAHDVSPYHEGLGTAISRDTVSGAAPTVSLSRRIVDLVSPSRLATWITQIVYSRRSTSGPVSPEWRTFK